MSEEYRTLLALYFRVGVRGLGPRVRWQRAQREDSAAKVAANGESGITRAGRAVRELSVPRVGGYALLAGLWVSGFDLPWAALLAAFVLGAIDDWRPMGAGVKALGQCVPAALLGLEVGGEAGIWIGLLAWVAQNAVNTFDHADGFLCALGGTAFPPLLAAPFLGVLPWNLLLRAKNRAGGDVAQAYFGDGGSLLAGVLLASQPEARWFLLVPTLDLARVVGLRLLAGQAPWVGDRRHLGHRFQDHGWNPKMGAVLALAALLPMGLASTHGHWVAALASAAVWAGLVVASRPPVAQA